VVVKRGLHPRKPMREETSPRRPRYTFVNAVCRSAWNPLDPIETGPPMPRRPPRTERALRVRRNGLARKQGSDVADARPSRDGITIRRHGNLVRRLSEREHRMLINRSRRSNNPRSSPTTKELAGGEGIAAAGGDLTTRLDASNDQGRGRSLLLGKLGHGISRLQGRASIRKWSAATRLILEGTWSGPRPTPYPRTLAAPGNTLAATGKKIECALPPRRVKRYEG